MLASSTMGNMRDTTKASPSFAPIATRPRDEVSHKGPKEPVVGTSTFSPAFDAVFGVTNNKQRAEKLSELAQKDWEDFVEGNETPLQAKERLQDEKPGLYIALDVVTTLQKHLALMLKQIQKNSTTSKSGRTRHAESPEVVGTGATKRRQEDGKTGTSDEENRPLPMSGRKTRKFLSDIGADDSDGTIGDP